MKSKAIAKALIGIVVIGGGLGYFIFQAAASSSSYSYTVDDFLSRDNAEAVNSIRLAGSVKSGTVTKDIEQMILNFVLEGGQSELPVEYKKTIPDNFTEGIEVVVVGRLDTDGKFQANKLLTKCESKYEAKLDDNEAKLEEKVN